jgi:hypothetical protein
MVHITALMVDIMNIELLFELAVIVMAMAAEVQVLLGQAAASVRIVVPLVHIF